MFFQNFKLAFCSVAFIRHTRLCRINSTLKRGVICVAFFLISNTAQAQYPLPTTSGQVSNLRQITLTILSDTLIQDTFTIIPNTVQIIDNQSNILDTSYFEIKNNLILSQPTLSIIHYPLSINYRVLPFDLGKKIQRLDSASIDPLAPPVRVEADYGNPLADNAPIFDKGLEYNGNYTQGISAGNAQNLVVNQNFNLNLAGRLGDMDILATMTDNNLPIQAEGNTQQLREIDKIFIQLKRKNQTLLAGDYELQRPLNTYFMSYYKKQKGINYAQSSSFILKNNLTTPQTAVLSSKIGAGIARGKFARNVLPVVEGNQGPYRLFGNETGGFFIILSGTERVYFDGKLMLRGDEHDYVIDYNRGDIVFTPKRLVTKDARIIVEYEYADQTYLRSTIFGSLQLQRGDVQPNGVSLSGTDQRNTAPLHDWKLRFDFYSEQDSKNATGTQALDSLDRSVLRNTGNDFDTNYPLSIRQAEDGFRVDRIQYQLLDTVVNGTLYRDILAYSTNPNLAKYTAAFTPVGEGKGNYIQVPTAANGRVYQWTAPSQSGELQGNFEPIKKLTPPNSQRLMTLGVDYQLFKRTKVFAELAMSNQDRNRFSRIGDSTNTGLALYAGFENQFNLGKKQGWQGQIESKYEGTQRTFKPLNPYRNAEFTRDWNVPTPLSIQTNNVLNSSINNNVNSIGNLAQTPSQLREQFINSSLKVNRKDWLSMRYDLATYTRGSVYKGLKNAGRLDIRRKDWAIIADINELNTGGVLEKSTFSRPRFDVSKIFNKNLKLGALIEREKNRKVDAKRDTFIRTSFYYDMWKMYIEKTDSNGNQYGLNVLQRFDYQPFTNRFSRVSKVNEVGLNGNMNTRRNTQLIWNITYRDLQTSDFSPVSLRAQKTYLGRLEYNFNLFKNTIYSNTLYELGSGQEQRLEYQYVRVNKGEGQYIWRNRNNDTIPQLDEFEIAPFTDQADYVRVTLFTNQFIRTNNAAFSQSLRIDPRAAWFEKEGILKFLSRFSTNSNMQIARRVKVEPLASPPTTTGGDGISQWNPFQLKIPDISLVALTISMRNALYFNRSNPIWDIELGQLDNRNRLVLVTGFEERGRQEWYIRSRWNIGKTVALQQYYATGSQANLSEAFFTRNYNLKLQKAEPELTWQIGSDFRLGFIYKYKNGVNTLKTIAPERLENNDFSLETTWNQSENSQLRAKFSYVQVAYTGERNTPIEFALLEGLQNGRNFLWNMSVDRVLSKNVFLNISYEGRKTGELRTIHVGRASVRANF